MHDVSQSLSLSNTQASRKRVILIATEDFLHGELELGSAGGEETDEAVSDPTFFFPVYVSYHRSIREDPLCPEKTVSLGHGRHRH
jgi:hypothetical protein